MKGTIKVRVVSFSLAALILAIGFGIYQWNQLRLLKQYMDYNNQRAFSELITSVSNIDTALQKGSYVSTPIMTASLAAQVWRESSTASAALSQLPLSELNLEKTQKFISQVGEYAYTLLRKSASGETLSSEDKKSIAELSQVCDSFATSLMSLQGKVIDGSYKLGTEKPNKNNEVAVQAIASSGSSEDNKSEVSGFDGIEQQFPKYASLIYDGPFSDHIEKMESSFLKGKATVSKEVAQKKAAEFLSVSADKLTSDGETEGRIPVYTFKTTGENKGELTIQVTKVGGYILLMNFSGNTGEPKIDSKEAVKTAKAFLNKHNFPNMKESYYTEYDGIITINFSYEENGVTCYPDLIKVSVARDTSKIVAFEARGYLMSHKERPLPAVKVSREQAQKIIDSSLKILSYSLAFIPSNGENEIFCHEFTCQDSKGKHYIFYINCDTGNEENVFILLENENGTLAV